ncbi:sigma-70 family RNA polymerase sigma factor [Candidatus Kaiserbacteria bacterium]|nr:sigma-70 family RNA polymerase sigma factor [Candidatus Kaiserbacteria bacterium]
MGKHFIPESGTEAHYVNAVRSMPILEREEELNLGRSARMGNRESSHELITSHLRLAVAVANKYRGYGLPVADLIQEANIGLMQAADRFDPERGFRFATYAMWWIRAAVQDYVLRTLSIVRLGATSDFKKAFFNLHKVKRVLGIDYEGDLKAKHLEEVAYLLSVSKSTVMDASRRLQPDTSLNEKVTDNKNKGAEVLEWVDALQDDNAVDMEDYLIAVEEGENRLKAMRSALGVLDPRKRRIFEARRLTEPPETLRALSAEFGLSHQRIRQLEIQAFEKVQARTRYLLAKRLREKRYAAKKRSKHELFDA